MEGIHDQYFRGIMCFSPLAPDAERELFVRIVTLREEFWNELLCSQGLPVVLERLRQLTESKPKVALKAEVLFERHTGTVGELATQLRLLNASANVEDWISPLAKVFADQGRLLDIWEELLVLQQKAIRHNLQLVVFVAKRYTRSAWPLSDLVGEGVIGLTRAVDLFNPCLGFRFNTFAIWQIRHHITRAIRNGESMVRIPVHIHTKRARLTHLQEHLAGQGYEVSLAEVDGGKTPQDLIFGMCHREVSLEGYDDSKDPDGSSAWINRIASPAKSADEIANDVRWGVSIRNALGLLKPVEALIVERRFGFGNNGSETLAQIGQSLSLSRERVRQLEERALGKLRAYLGGTAPDEWDSFAAKGFRAALRG
jgi:RNA polymerase nonessential primary-like sigma factor